MDTDVFDYLKEDHHETWEKATRAVRFLKTLGLEIEIRHPLKKAAQDWHEVADKDVAIPAAPERIDKNRPPVTPVEIPYITNRKGKRTKAAGWLIEVVGRYIVNYWYETHSSITISRALAKVTSSKTQTYSRSNFGKQIKIFEACGLIREVRPSIGNKPALYKINPNYDPNHPRLTFLKKWHPNGFKVYDLNDPTQNTESNKDSEDLRLIHTNAKEK